MYKLLKYVLNVNLFLAPIFLSISYAVASASTADDNYALACGKAQLKANKCVKDQSGSTSGVFGSLASKVTASDMGKTAANQASSQAANLICKSELEMALKLCQPQ